jgi:hypothetical protein
MNTKNMNKIIFAALFFLMTVPMCAMAQDSSKKELVLTLGYYMNNNRIIYVMANAKTKIDGKFQPVKGVVINLYLDADSAANLISKVTSDKNGLAKAIIPPALKDLWIGAPKHSFLAVTEANKDFGAITAEASVSKSKIIIDTASDGETKTIIVSVTSFNGTDWVPAKDVEMKVGVNRSGGGILSAGDEETYTTDSSGTVSVEFKKAKLPGNEKGEILLVAKADENELYGNLLVEKTVPWGVAVKVDHSFFNQRTLWSTRFRTPYWLLFMAYSIVFGVWGTIIYLVMQMIKIKKLGRKTNTDEVV